MGLIRRGGVAYSFAGMSKAFRQWTVLPHKPIDKLAANLWRVVGGLPRMPLKRTMVVARLGDGRLVIHSAIALDEVGMSELEAWGTPAFLLVPNGWHRLDARVYKDRYPKLIVLAPAGSRRRVQRVVNVNGDYRDFPTTEDIALVHLAGSKDREGVMTVRSADGVTLVFADAVMNVRLGSGLRKLVSRLLGYTGKPQMTPLARLVLLKDKPALRAHLDALAGTPGLVRLIPGHGPDITDRPAQALRAVAAAL